MPIVRIPEDAGPRLEAGTYEMTVIKVREDHIENSQFGTGDVIKFTLRTNDDTFTELEAMANDSLTPLSKLTKWLNALGVGITPGVAVDLEKAEGRTCLVNVTVEDKGEKGQFNKVAEILPPLRTQSARREALAPVEASDGSDEPFTHPAAVAGENVVDARLASEAQLEHVKHLLIDTSLDYADVAIELNLPKNPSEMRVPDVARIVNHLTDLKQKVRA